MQGKVIQKNSFQLKRRKHLWKIIVALATIAFLVYQQYYQQPKSSQQDGHAKSLPDDLKYLLPKPTEDQIVHRSHYSFSYNEAHEQANWVAYQLKKEHLTDADRERPYFYEDPLVTTQSADWRNYKNSGYDRGHLCPAGDRRFSDEAYNETFFTSNIVPQKNDFNAGVWNRLEMQTRYWAKKYGSITVITAGVLKEGLPSIGYENVSVPEAFYKIIVVDVDRAIKAIAFLVPHQESNMQLDSFVVSVDEIERLTGINFFEKLPDSIENALESAVKTEGWFKSN